MLLQFIYLSCMIWIETKSNINFQYEYIGSIDNLKELAVKTWCSNSIFSMPPVIWDGKNIWQKNQYHGICHLLNSKDISAQKREKTTAHKVLSFSTWL